MDFKQELRDLMAAQAPLIHLVTYEESRVLRAVSELDVAGKLGCKSAVTSLASCVTWLPNCAA